jgi:hypothetical protein
MCNRKENRRHLLTDLNLEMNRWFIELEFGLLYIFSKNINYSIGWHIDNPNSSYTSFLDIFYNWFNLKLFFDKRNRDQSLYFLTLKQKNQNNLKKKEKKNCLKKKKKKWWKWIKNCSRWWEASILLDQNSDGERIV